MYFGGYAVVNNFPGHANRPKVVSNLTILIP